MYQESYYNFCARLMEQEGLIWTHRYEKDKHILVIGDTNFVFRPIEGLTTVPYADSEASEFNGIDQLHEGRRFGVGKVTFQDFNHQNPSSPLMLVQAEPQTLRHARLDATERFEHQSLYDHGDDGNRYARIAMQAEEAQAHRYTGSGYAWRMTTAGSVTVANHPVMANNQEYAILHVRHEAVNDYTQHAAKMPYRNSFALLPQNIPYRAPRNTPKPVIHGTQSAIVVGPKGEQIHTNGSCVKLHFLWDRRGQMDGSDSMWIRVSQPWAGAGWGAAAIPRIGQEVLVSFNQGDPDNPVIVGRVFNGEQGNPYHGAAGQTMGIKSQTHKGQGSNELRFSDVNGAQEVFLHAQKDMKTVIKDSETHTVEAGARTVSLLKGSETKQIAQGGLSETIALTRDTTANVINTKAIASKAGPGMQSHQASDGMEFRVGESIVTMTPDGIKLAHGPSTILMNANGIYLDAPVIHLNQGSAQAPEQALALQWAEAQAMIAQGLASPDPATRAAAGKLANSLKAQQMAKLADHVYHPNDPPPTGWKMVTNDPEALKAFGLKPSDFLKGGSNFGAQMYVPDPKVFGDSMKPSIAFKGTQQLFGEDMTNNMAQGLGADAPYYRSAVSIGKNIQAAGASSGVDFTGHSLGGGLASAAAEASGSSAMTFNAAGLNPGTSAVSGRLRRTSPRKRTEPSGCACAGNHTTAGTIRPCEQCGATVSDCSIPFCKTHTMVSGPVSAASHSAAAAVCVALTDRKTRSTVRSISAGSVRTGPGTTMRRSPSRSVNSSRRVRPHSKGVRPASCSAAATVVPMAPGPTTAISVPISAFMRGTPVTAHADGMVARVEAAFRTDPNPNPNSIARFSARS